MAGLALNGGVGDLVLNLLPTPPEYSLGRRLTHLAMDDLLAGLAALRNALQRVCVGSGTDRQELSTWRLWRKARRAGRAAVSKKETSAASCGQIKAMLNRYPQGDPTILCRTLLGSGCAWATCPPASASQWSSVSCWAAGPLAAAGKRMIDRPVQLFVQGGHPRLLMGRLGESITAFCGGIRWPSRIGRSSSTAC